MHRENSLDKQKTQNNVEATMFPVLDQRSNSSLSQKSQSRSIPIAHTQRSESEIQQEEGEALAEYRDYLMRQRITSAKHSRSPPVHKVPAVYPMGRASLQSIIMNDPSLFLQPQTPVHYGFPVAVIPPPQSHDEASSQEGIFELEL